MEEVLVRRSFRNPKAIGLVPSRPPSRPRPFETEGQLLEAARQTLYERNHLAEEDQEDVGRDRTPCEEDLGIMPDTPWARYLHASIVLSRQLPLVHRMLEAELEPFQREVVLAMLLVELGMFELQSCCSADLVWALKVPGERILEAYREMSATSVLIRSGLVVYQDQDEEIARRELLLDPSLVDETLNSPEEEDSSCWPIQNQEECLDYWRKLVDAFERKQRIMRRMIRVGYSMGRRWKSRTHRVRKLMGQLYDTLAKSPDWSLSRFFESAKKTCNRNECQVLAILVGRAAGHRSGSALYTTEGMAMALASHPDEVEQLFVLFGPEGRLVRELLIQPAHNAFLLTADPESLSEVEWDLSDKSLHVVGIDRKLVSNKGRTFSRKPLLSLDQVILAEQTRVSLKMALAQARHYSVLLDDWGLGKVIPYGRAVTLLFEGPPGVGKTATAEGLAMELGRNILVANYAQVQNCFVGETEKSIVATFRTALREGALLFWDEADAMFYARDLARQTFEVRHVNVLLQELERFEGVVVLATNRRDSLDPALERRISIKIQFERPDRDMRRAIWEQILPTEIPLGPDVDLDEMAGADLSGAEIKNCVVNAARLALARGAEQSVTMADFERAIEMELGGKWTDNAASEIGFMAGSAEDGTIHLRTRQCKVLGVSEGLIRWIAFSAFLQFSPTSQPTPLSAS